jgi:dienelactone hydrolase
MRHAVRLASLAVLALAAPALAQPAPAEPGMWAEQPALPAIVAGDTTPASLLEMYRVPAERFAVTLEPGKHGRTFVSYEASFPSAIKDRSPVIHGTLYLPIDAKAGDRRPAAVVVHHLGGSFDAEAILAQHLATHGLVAFFISLPNYGKRRAPGTREGFLEPKDPVGSFMGFRQAALDVIRAADMLRARPEVDPARVGAVGVSLGAIVTSLARGVDPRIGRTVLVIGGGDLPRLIAESQEAQAMLARKGSSLPSGDLLAEALRPVDPLTFASRVRTEDVLMLNASRDEIIPEGSTLALWEAYGRPRLRWFDCGHYGVVLHILTVMNESLDHLRGEDPVPTR